MRRYLKTVVAVVTAALVALQSAVSDGQVTYSEWVSIALVVLGAIGVYYVENEQLPEVAAQHRLDEPPEADHAQHRAL